MYARRGQVSARLSTGRVGPRLASLRSPMGVRGRSTASHSPLRTRGSGRGLSVPGCCRVKGLGGTKPLVCMCGSRFSSLRPWHPAQRLSPSAAALTLGSRLGLSWEDSTCTSQVTPSPFPLWSPPVRFNPPSRSARFNPPTSHPAQYVTLAVASVRVARWRLKLPRRAPVLSAALLAFFSPPPGPTRRWRVRFAQLRCGRRRSPAGIAFSLIHRFSASRQTPEGVHVAGRHLS